MEKTIKTYIKYVDNIIENENLSNEEMLKFKEEHLIKIGFFSHERLVHLLVTLAFAIMEMISLCLVVMNFSVPIMILMILFLVLLIPYIRHYYILENSVQKMYSQYDKICGKINQV